MGPSSRENEIVKKILVIVGVLVLLAGAGAGGWYYMSMKNLKAKNKASEAFADTSIRAVIAGWDVRELDKRASPELKTSAGSGGLDKVMTLTRTRLGALKQYHGLDDESEIMHHFDTGVDTAEYSARADFERGSAVIRVQLVSRGDDPWRLAAFRVRSPALLEAPAEQTKAAEPAKEAARPAEASPAPKPAPVAAPVPPAAAPGPAVAKSAPPAPPPAVAAEPKPAAAAPVAIETAAAEPARARRASFATADLRRCLDLMDNYKVARCAGKP